MDSGNLFFYFCATSSGLTRTSVRLCVKLALLFGFCHDTCCPFHRKNTSWKCLLSRVIEFDKPGRVSILLLYNIQSKNDIYFDLASHALFNSLIRSWNSGKDYQNTNELLNSIISYFTLNFSSFNFHQQKTINKLKNAIELFTVFSIRFCGCCCCVWWRKNAYSKTQHFDWIIAIEAKAWSDYHATMSTQNNTHNTHETEKKNRINISSIK